MRENEFQASLIKRLKDLFPGCIVMKNDSSYKQGIPDLTIFWGEHWAALECKRSANAMKQPNQEYYVQLMNAMSFARFIFPANVEEVLYDLARFFET